jgi:hypothetical protein
MQGSWYCTPTCMESALREALHWVRGNKKPVPPPAHRMPLGLMMLSREELTIEQLRSALDAQRAAGRGRIGEWLLNMGFVTEHQVTAALARQWSCPVLRTDSVSLPSNRVPDIPLLLLESFQMIPVDFVQTTATLHVAFGDSIDYRVLYALEQMLECRTVPCLVKPSLLRGRLLSLAESRHTKEIVFDRVADTAEFARILGSYATTMSASEIRMVHCAHYLWIRLERVPDSRINLLFRTAAEPLFSAG